ncbi:MAG: hypothetical protein GY937_25425, partial [bacterium]|nr:hypothetical protein [bacterium]
GTMIRIRFRNLNDSPDAGETFVQVFDEILRQQFDGTPDNTTIGVEVRHPALSYPAFLPFMPKKKLNAQWVLALLYKIMQSEEELNLDDELLLSFTSVIVPQKGAGWHKRQRGRWASWFSRMCDKGGCIQQILNKDNLCAARAIIVALAYNNREADPAAYKALRRNDRGATAQTKSAQDLMDAAGLPDAPCGPDEIKCMEQALLERGMSVQVKVFAKDCCNALLYSGTEANEQVYLYLHDGHYDIVKSPSGFFNSSFYCKHCDKAYSNRYKHRCKYVCTKCDARVPCAIGERKHCAICNCNFNSVECYDRHLAVNQGSSRCMRFKLCRMCRKGYPTNRQHVCGAAKCRNCGKFYKETHYCFIQPIVDTPNKKRVAPGQQL